MEIKKLQELAVVELDLKQFKMCDPLQLKVVSEVFQEVLCSRDSLLAESFKDVNLHTCKLDQYNVWFGKGLRTFKKNATCYCQCKGVGNLCNCSCGALVKKLIEFRIREILKFKPGRPAINGKTKLKQLLESQIAYEDKNTQFGSRFESRWMKW